MFNHINESQIWYLGIINNQSKTFRLEAALNRSEETLKKFILKYVPIGNIIICDGWADYRFLDSGKTGYHYIVTNHSIGNFGYDMESYRSDLEYLKI